jgi:hypothetical protein
LADNNDLAEEGTTVVVRVVSEYVMLSRGQRDYKILDFPNRIALNLSLDNFLYIISISENRERVVDRIHL